VDVPELGYLTSDKPCARGELCVRSPSLFSGYYNDPAATAEVPRAAGRGQPAALWPICTAAPQAFVKDGDKIYYRTGDIARMVRCVVAVAAVAAVIAERAPALMRTAQTDKGRIELIDRKKHVFKLAQGEFVAPELLETAYSLCGLVEQVLACCARTAAGLAHTRGAAAAGLRARGPAAQLRGCRGGALACVPQAVPRVRRAGGPEPLACALVIRAPQPPASSAQGSRAAREILQAFARIGSATSADGCAGSANSSAQQPR
jgi:hypothetical protein